MTTLRTANEVKEQVISSLENERRNQKKVAHAALGNNRKELLHIMKKYVKSRRLFFLTWVPAFVFPSYQYDESGDLCAIQWECEDVTFQFVKEEGVWNTISVFEYRNVITDNLSRLEVILQRSFPFYTIYIHIGRYRLGKYLI